MTTFTESITQFQSSMSKRFNWDYFLQDNVTGSIWLTIWVTLLALVTAVYTVGQLRVSPIFSIISA